MSRNAERACIEAVNEAEEHRERERDERAKFFADGAETLSWVSTRYCYPEHGQRVLMRYESGEIFIGCNYDGKEWHTDEGDWVSTPSHWAIVKGPQ